MRERCIDCSELRFQKLRNSILARACDSFSSFRILFFNNENTHNFRSSALFHGVRFDIPTQPFDPNLWGSTLETSRMLIEIHVEKSEHLKCPYKPNTVYLCDGGRFNSANICNLGSRWKCSTKHKGLSKELVVP